MDARFVKMDARFVTIDAQFAKINTRFDELSAQLRTDIESVRSDVKLVAEAFGAQDKRNRRNDADHRRFKTQREDHGVRILALEPKRPKTSA